MKKRIVLASILKPLNDTRMFEKWAVSLARSGDYDVTVIGQHGEHPTESGITVISLGSLKRLSFKRWLASFKVLQLTLKVKPELLVVNTHELLIVGLANRILFGSKIIYDVQENYFRNILYGQSFPALIRWPLAAWVRIKERVSGLWTHCYTLAEAGYERELTFLGKRATIIENKCVVPRGFRRAPIQGEIRLLFSGTLAESTGVFRAMGLARQLRGLDDRIALTIIGFAARVEVQQQIKDAAAEEPWIQLIGVDKLVPHQEIMSAISKAHFGMIAYPPSPHTDNSVPTKLYEYLACGLPMLLQKHSRWSALCNSCQAAIELDFQFPDPQRILKEMREKTFFTSTPQHVSWDEEANRLLALMTSISQG